MHVATVLAEVSTPRAVIIGACVAELPTSFRLLTIARGLLILAAIVAWSIAGLRITSGTLTWTAACFVFAFGPS